MKISVKLGVSQNTDFQTFSLDDLGLTLQEWEELTDDEKEKAVTDAVNDLPSQPFWMVDSFEEK